MHRTDLIAPSARPRRTSAVRGIALALAVATGTGGVAALLTYTAPVSAQTGLGGNQVITQTTFSDLAAKVTPAVVAIRSEGGPVTSRSQGRRLPPDHPFNEFMERFFGEQFGEEGMEEFERRFGENGPQFNQRRRPRRSQGSGFIVSADGYIVTNEHVVENSGSIIVITNDEEEYEAKIVGADPRTDLAVLKIETHEDLPYVEFSDVEANVGDWVAAVGNPFGLGGTVTTGIVSARGRHIGNGPYDDFLQIDAAVNRGNSGGPTFNLGGQVVGVNTAIYSPNGGSVGIGFAIPASIASDVVGQLIDNGQITRGWLGVSIQTVTPDIARSVGLDFPAGAIVSEVFPGGPAEQAGLEPGDVILDVDGRQIDSSRDLARVVAEIRPGHAAEISIHRNRGGETVSVDIGTMPSDPNLARLDPRERSLEQEEEPADTTVEDRLAELGLKVAPASEVDDDEDARGVVVTDVVDGSEAADKGISSGDRILRIDGAPVNTPVELAAALDEAQDDGLSSVLVLLRSDTGQHFVTLELTRA